MTNARTEMVPSTASDYTIVGAVYRPVPVVAKQKRIGI